jgi:hypothetical protein
MAYAFSRVNQALGGDEQQENQDIFGGAGQPQQQGVQGQNPAGTTPQGVVAKTSTAGSIGGGMAPSSEIQAPQEAAAGGAGAASKILARNESTTPDQVKGLGAKLSSARSGLQSEANQYVEGARKADYNVAGGDVNDLIGGANTEGASRASRLLSGVNAPQAERFAPKTQTSFQEVNELGTEAGVSNMLRRQAGARATKGELGIEAALLRRDPRFQQTRSQLVSEGAALAGERAKVLGEGAEGVNTQAEKLRAENYKRAQEALRGNLGTARSAIDTDIAARVASENAARRELAARGLGQNEQYAQELAAAKAKYGDVEGEMTRFGSLAGEVSAADLYDEPSASRYSRISELLGEPGQVRLAGRGAGNRQNFDIESYRGAAEELASRRLAEKARDKKADEERAAQATALAAEQMAKSKAKYEGQIAAAEEERDFVAGIQPGTLNIPTGPAPAPEGFVFASQGPGGGPPVLENTEEDEDAAPGRLRL